MLSPSEVYLIHGKIDELTGLSGVEKKLLKRWSDPKEWPDEGTFRQWLDLIKDTATGMSSADLESLAELGDRMARRGFTAGAAAGVSDTRQTIQFLQKEMGLDGVDKFRSINTDGDGETEADLPASNLLADLQLLHDGEKKEIRDRVKAVLADPVFRFEPMPTKEEYREKVSQWLAYLAAQGLGSIGFPREYGGEDDMVGYATVFEMLASHDLSLAIKFGVHFGLFGGSVFNLGTKEHHNKYLAAIGDLSLPGCFAMTETGHGSNVRDIETTATYDPDLGQIVVHSPSFRAGKEYIGNAMESRMASVFAQLIVQGENHGVHAVLVPIRDASGQLLDGVRAEDNGYKMGLNGVDNGRLWFDQVRVPRENLLNRFGSITPTGRYESTIANPSKRFFTMLGTLVAGRISVAKGGIAAAKVALTIAVKYGLHRRQFGPDSKSAETLIMDYPTHQRRLLPKLSKVYATHFALDNLMQRYEVRTEEDAREIETLAAGIKAYGTWLSTETIQESREACGGKGYLWVNRFTDLKADSDIFTTFEGDNTVLLQLVAKGLLGAFKDEFHDAGFLGVYRYLRSQASDSLLTINPIYKRKTDADHLHDERFHSHALQFRDRKLLHALADRMRTMLKKRITPYDVFLRTQTHMIALAKAFIERFIYEEFQAEVAKIEDGELKDLMQQVLQLFALTTIEENKGWYLEQSYMDGVKTKAIRRQVDRLCGRLRDHAELLVDGFGIPNGLIGAPIAFNVYS